MYTQPLCAADRCLSLEKQACQDLTGNSPLIIDTAQVTLPKVLRSQDYHTAIVGKWHLGQQHNLVGSNPEKLGEMKVLFRQIRDWGMILQQFLITFEDRCRI